MNGFLLIDKDKEWTSSDVVSKLRGILHEKAIGHAGTLDPNATGLLIVMVGKCTKASDYIMHHDKEYICTLKLGIKTDTQDIWGNILQSREASVTLEKLNNALMHFTGEILQVPPMYSAIKIKGQKLYDIARRGGEVEREPRAIKVHSIDVISGDKDEYVLDIKCSSGTYVRTLCNDIGDYLGCCGCMMELRRVKIGDISVENAHRISEIHDDTYLLPPDGFVSDLPEKVKNKIFGQT